VSEENNELPRGWVWTTLEEVTAPIRISVQPIEYPTLPYVGMEHVEAETMRLIGTGPASELKSSTVRFWPGDVLYGRLRPYLNKVLRPDFEGLCSPEFLVFRKPINLDSRYLQYFLNSWNFKEFASHLNEGDRPRVDWSQLKDFPFPLAPFLEQQRIVSVIEQQFTRLGVGVAALKRAQAKLKRYRAAVLKAAVEGKLTEAWRAEHPTTEPASILLERILRERHAKWEADLRAKGKDPAKVKYVEPAKPDMEGLPEGWCWVMLGMVANIQLGKMLSPKAYEDGLLQMPYLRNENVRWGSIDYSDVKKMGFKDRELEKYRLEPSDLLVCEGGEAGRCAVNKDASGQFMYQKALHRVRVIDGVISPYFIQFCMQHYVASKTIIPRPSETTIQHLPLEKMEILPIPLPPIAEQVQIIAEVEQRLSIVTQLEAIIEANLKRAERLRQSILKEAFAGRLVPQDPNDEPASVLLERILKERQGQKKGANGNGRFVRVSDEPVQIDVEGTRQVELWEGVGGGE
jgi:type I restriction enzyme S subunit